MNVSVMILEMAVVLLGLGFLLADLWIPPERKRRLGYVAAAGLGLIFIGSLYFRADQPSMPSATCTSWTAWRCSSNASSSSRPSWSCSWPWNLPIGIRSGISEFYALILFALAGMMFAASANDFILLFASLELITVTFYVLTSFQRARLSSLEAGMKYLIIGALSTAFTVYGIALVFGSTNTTSFEKIAAAGSALTEQSGLSHWVCC